MFHDETVPDPVAQVEKPPTADSVPFNSGPRLQDRDKLLLLFRSRAAGRTAARLIGQTVLPRFFEAEDPIANGLPVNAECARNFLPAETAKDPRKGAKAAGNRAILVFAA